MGDNNPFVLVKFSHEGNVYPYIALRYEANSFLNLHPEIGRYNDNDDDIITINRPPPTNDDDTFVVVYNNPPPPPPPPGANKIRIFPLSHRQNNDMPEGRPDAAAAEAAEIMAVLASQDPGVVTRNLTTKETNKLYKNLMDKAALREEKGGRRRSSARRSSAKKRASRRKPRSTKKRATRRYRRRRA